LDTKWKKWKIILEFTAYFIGLTLLISNLGSVPYVIYTIRNTPYEDIFSDSMDYQESQDFRCFISNRLEELLGIATGGRGWRNYGLYYEDETAISGTDFSYEPQLYTNTAVAEEAADRFGTSFQFASLADMEAAYEDWLGNSEGLNNDDYDKTTSESRMAALARDKNLLYAVVYQQKLLYTNIDGYEDKTGKAWDGEDISAVIPAEDYNFSLWFNQKGDGKVQIRKDGHEENIYGNGIYTSESRWFVPGYVNFSVDDSTDDAVIFLAAAKSPKLYVVGNYSDYGTVQYGGTLYYMQQNLLSAKHSFRLQFGLLGAAAFLLLLSLFWRKGRRLAKQAILIRTRKIWLELKILLFIILPLALLLTDGLGLLRNLYLILRDAFYSMDLQYSIELYSNYMGSFYINPLFSGGFLLVVCFWLLYLGILDLRGNKGSQKTLVVNLLRTKDLTLPLQKKMVKRYRMIFLTGFLIPLLSFGVITLIAIRARNIYDGSIREYYIDGRMEYNFVSRFTPLFVLLLIVFLLLFCGAASIMYLRQNRRMAEDIGALAGQIEKVRADSLAEKLVLPQDSDLAAAAENLNEIQQGMDTALQKQMRSERMKVELVSNVSHDIKTPLTSIISYIELLKQEEELPEHVKEYIQILGEKSERLKGIVQDVFEISKASSGQLSVNLELLDLGKLLRQTIADMNPQIEESGLLLKASIPEEPVSIRADGQRLYRVFQNLLQNTLKYSLPGSRVFLTLTQKDNIAVVSVKNTSQMELDASTDFTERFVRGDASRTDGGSGLGLSIARSFTEACGGSFRVATDADLFTVTVSFPEAADTP